MVYTDEGHILLDSGRLITSPNVISLVERFDRLKHEDFQPSAISDLRERWSVPEDQEITVQPSVKSEVSTPVQTEFDVVLTAIGSDRMGTIKLVREVTGLPLGESKAAIDKLPHKLKLSASREDADALISKFQAVGATVEAH